jgi:hypothetical protein
MSIRTGGETKENTMEVIRIAALGAGYEIPTDCG